MKGLILEGGGAKGAYQIGAYRALRKIGLEFDGIAGTSIGALNGAYMIQNDINVMEDIWLQADYKQFIDVDEETYHKIKDVDFTAKNINKIFSMVNKAIKNQGIDFSPLRKTLEKTLNEEAIRNSSKEFGLVTVMWDRKINPHKMYINDIPNGKLIDYLIATASLPIFNLEKIDGKLYLDGAFYDNIPINLLKEKGYDEFVVVRLADDFRGRLKLKEFADDSFNLKTIIPSQSLGGALNLDKDNVMKNIDLGFYDTMKAYGKYEGIIYCFITNIKYSESYCFELIKNMSDNAMSQLCNLLGIDREPSLRTLFEIIVPRLCTILGLSTNASYKDIVYCMYEKKLEETKINRLNLYDFDKVFELVNKNIINKYENNNKNIQKQKLLKFAINIIIEDIKNRQI